jgi:hypothetical protein
MAAGYCCPGCGEDVLDAVPYSMVREDGERGLPERPAEGTVCRVTRPHVFDLGGGLLTMCGG